MTQEIPKKLFESTYWSKGYLFNITKKVLGWTMGDISEIVSITPNQIVLFLGYQAFIDTNNAFEKKYLVGPDGEVILSQEFEELEILKTYADEIEFNSKYHTRFELYFLYECKVTVLPFNNMAEAHSMIKKL